jgi:hypothetical protein
MKKLILFIALLSLVAFKAAPVFAGPYDRENANTAGYVKAVSASSSSEVVAAPCYIHAVTVLATAANAVVGIIDTQGTTGTAVAEIGQATQYASNRQVFNPPLKIENGVYANVSNGSVVVEYR